MIANDSFSSYLLDRNLHHLLRKANDNCFCYLKNPLVGFFLLNKKERREREYRYCFSSHRVLECRMFVEYFPMMFHIKSVTKQIVLFD